MDNEIKTTHFLNNQNICRACLNKEANMSSIYDNDVKEMFISCTSLTVYPIALD